MGGTVVVGRGQGETHVMCAMCVSSKGRWEVIVVGYVPIETCFRWCNQWCRNTMVMKLEWRWAAERATATATIRIHTGLDSK